MHGSNPETIRNVETDDDGEELPKGRIARLAHEILADHLREGKGDIDPVEMVENSRGVIPWESQALVNAITRIIEGKAAGGGVSAHHPRKNAKTKNPQRETVYLTIPTDQIVRDIITQARAVSSGRSNGTDLQAVNSYADAIRKGERLPPILVGRRNPETPDDENAVYFLIDGWHRLEAQADQIGMTEVDCEVTGETDLNACRWMAVERNRTNGVKYVQNDRLGVFKAYIEAGQHLEEKGRFMVVKSARDISNDLAGFRISRQVVAKWAMEHYPDVYEAMPGREVQQRVADSERQDQAAKWAAERREIAMKAVLSQAVAIYRDAPRWGEERKRLAELVKALPVRMTKGRIEGSQQRAFEQLFDEPQRGPRVTPDEF